MDIIKIAPTPSATLDATSTRGRPWQLGDLLYGKVLRRLSVETITLQIGTTIVQAQTEAAVQEGDLLHLRVVSLDQPQPVLQRVLPETDDSRAFLQAMRNVLPKAGELGHLLRTLAYESGNAPAFLPDELLTSIADLFETLPEFDEQPNPAFFRQVVARSGHFLEANLAESSSASQRLYTDDFKANLLKLAALVHARLPSSKPDPEGTTSSETFEQQFVVLRKVAQTVESALARVTLNQLDSIPHENTVHVVHTLDLPVKDRETVSVLHLHIEEDKPRPGPDEIPQHWSVTLSFELQGIGPVHAKLSWSTAGLTANLWAEDTQTLANMEQGIEYLSKRLADADLAVQSINCFQGRPARKADRDRELHHHDLIDLKV